MALALTVIPELVSQLRSLRTVLKTPDSTVTVPLTETILAVKNDVEVTTITTSAADRTPAVSRFTMKVDDPTMKDVGILFRMQI